MHFLDPYSRQYLFSRLLFLALVAFVWVPDAVHYFKTRNKPPL